MCARKTLSLSWETGQECNEIVYCKWLLSIEIDSNHATCGTAVISWSNVVAQLQKSGLPTKSIQGKEWWLYTNKNVIIPTLHLFIQSPPEEYWKSFNPFFHVDIAIIVFVKWAKNWKKNQNYHEIFKVYLFTYQDIEGRHSAHQVHATLRVVHQFHFSPCSLTTYSLSYAH